MDFEQSGEGLWSAEGRDLDVGTTGFRMPEINAFETPGCEAAALEFGFQWTPEFEGSDGQLTILRNDIEVGTHRLAAFGRTDVNVVLQQLGRASKLQLRLSLITPAATLPLNRPAGAPKPGQITDMTLRLGENDVGTRIELARAARDTAERLGLKGDYMKAGRSEALSAQIRQSLADRRGYSAIRLGDGEGRVLGFMQGVTRHEALYGLLNYQFGPNSIGAWKDAHGPRWMDAAAAALLTLLDDSIANADAVGIPVAEYFTKVEEDCTLAVVAYACCTQYVLARYPQATRNAIVGTNVFRLAATDPTFFPQLAAAADRVVTVGAWDLSDRLEPALGVEEITHIQTQRHFTFGTETPTGQFPDLYKVTEAAIRNLGDLRGKLFLVGAGILGKHYCNVIKSRGGVTLDIGSVFDAWAGQGRPDALRNAEKLSLESYRS